MLKTLIRSRSWLATATWAVPLPSGEIIASRAQLRDMSIRLRVLPPKEAPPQTNQWPRGKTMRSEEHTSELQSRQYLVCRLLLEKKKQYVQSYTTHHNIKTVL